MFVVASWHVRSKKKKKINTEREGAQRFVGICVDHGVSQLNVTTIVDNTALKRVGGPGNLLISNTT